MSKFLFAATATAMVAMSSAALAGQPADKPANNDNQAAGCSSRAVTASSDASKNTGQARKDSANNPEGFGGPINLTLRAMDI